MLTNTQRPAYRVPLGVLCLLLELGELALVVDGCVDLPDDEEDEAGEHDTSDGAQHDGQDVHRLGAH